MRFHPIAACVLAVALASLTPGVASAQRKQTTHTPQASRHLILPSALARALARNPRLTAAERDIGIATGQRIRAGAIPNPEASFELDNALGSGQHRGLRSAETTLQLSQLIELGGKRDARIAAGAAGYDAARWQRAALRLEILSETAVAFVKVLGAQRRVQILGVQVEALDRLTPLLQRRVDAGASAPGEVSRAQVAADLARADRERAATELSIARRELAAAMGLSTPDFSSVTGNLARIGSPPKFQTVLQAVEGNPQLVRWTAIRAQRHAELLSARLNAVPDVRAGIGWRHYRDTGDNAVRFSLSVPLPVWDQNQGSILEARESLAKTEAERATNKLALTVLLGRAYDTLAGSSREISLLRSSAIPKAREALAAIEDGYAQGRFSLLEVLDAQAAVAQSALRELEALMLFHTAVATIEGLTGSPLTLRGLPK